MFPVAPRSPECQQGSGPEIPTGPENPRPPSGSWSRSRHLPQQAWPQHQLCSTANPGAATPLSPCSPGPTGSPARAASPGPGLCDPRCGGLSSGCGVWGWSPQEPGRGVRAQLGPPRGPSLGFPGTSCPAGAGAGAHLGLEEAVSAQAGLAGCRGEAAPSGVAGPRASQPPSCPRSLFP